MNIQEEIAVKAREILKEAAELRDARNFGAVNWGDLDVVNVVSCTGMNGDHWFEVIIEEASEFSDLGPFVFKRLRVIFNQAISVRTEW